VAEVVARGIAFPQQLGRNGAYLWNTAAGKLFAADQSLTHRAFLVAVVVQKMTQGRLGQTGTVMIPRFEALDCYNEQAGKERNGDRESSLLTDRAVGDLSELPPLRALSPTCGVLAAVTPDGWFHPSHLSLDLLRQMCRRT